MRGFRVLIGVASAIAIMVIASQGCQDPTQVTLDISLTTRAQCIEVPHGTAITVGIEPADVEERVRSGFVNAKTMDCDPVTRHIGTLVITPADPERASVIVVSGYRKDPAECKPPTYEGCIVARRRWSFAKRRPLRMPITIDPKCADVPCDAFSTCRDGLCFPSEVDTNACEGEGCNEPGASADGGTNVDAAVDAEGGPPPDGGPNADAPLGDAPVGDAPDDAPFDGGTSSPSCTGTTMHCFSGAGSTVSCGGGANVCCDTSMTPFACNPAEACVSPRHCCSDSDCATYQFCSDHPVDFPGFCMNKTDGGDDAGDAGGPVPRCETKMPAGEDLICWLGPTAGICAPPSDCCDSQMPAACPPQGNCIGSRYCCTVDNCGTDGGWACSRSQMQIAVGQPGQCVVQQGVIEPSCETDTGNLRCGGDPTCNGLVKQCCAPNTCTTAGCGGKAQRCCKASDCASNVCNGKGVPLPDNTFAPGFCQP